MHLKNYKWYKIADTIDEINFSPEGLEEVEVNGKSICIAFHNNMLFACIQKCPHAGAIMANGYLDALGHIVCPEHQYKFSLQNGRNISGEGYYLKTFPVDIRKEGIFVGIEEAAYLTG